jgi:hypothetical protein
MRPVAASRSRRVTGIPVWCYQRSISRQRLAMSRRNQSERAKSSHDEVDPALSGRAPLVYPDEDVLGHRRGRVSQGADRDQEITISGAMPRRPRLVLVRADPGAAATPGTRLPLLFRHCPPGKAVCADRLEAAAPREIELGKFLDNKLDRHVAHRRLPTLSRSRFTQAPPAGRRSRGDFMSEHRAA